MPSNKEFLKQPPVAVSPLIKVGRYAMLIAGIFYGISKQKLYVVLETAYLEKEAEIQRMIAEQKAKRMMRKGRK